MKPLENHRSVTSEGVEESAAFGISQENHAHIMTLLRDAIYTDKVMAVIREYSANAWDAHRMSGKPDLPIKVTLPTIMDPVLTIQDFGPGLSHEAVFQIYTQYGASTKRDSDTAVGMLGIGSKSAFAYADSFTIESRHGGKQRIYAAVLDESEKGKIDLLAEQDCSEDETGVTIQVAVQVTDIPEFTRKAREFFAFMEPKPEINTLLPVPNHTDRFDSENGHGYIYRPQYGERGQWYALMGCVPYRINLEQLKGLDGSSLVPETLFQHAGVLNFGIGEVQISASREELKYGKFTNKALLDKFNALLDEYIKKVADEINGLDLTQWDKRQRARPLSRLKLAVPDEFNELFKATVNFPEAMMEKFTITYKDGRHPTHINVDEGRIGFYLKDDDRKIDWFGIPRTAFLVRAKYKPNPADYTTAPDGKLVLKPAEERTEDPNREKYSWDEVRADLDAMLDKMHCTGLPIGKLSEQTWEMPDWERRRLEQEAERRAQKKVYNAKHHARAFRWNAADETSRPLSSNWETITEPPTEDSPYVVLYYFEVEGMGDNAFYRAAREMKALATRLGIPVPEVYAYKRSEKKPLDPDKIIGRPFAEWYAEWKKALPTVLPAVEECWENQQWIAMLPGPNSLQPNHHTFRALAGKLGSNHPILNFLRDAMNARGKLKKHTSDYRRAVYDLDAGSVFAGKTAKAEEARDALHAVYPLIPLFSGGIKVVWQSDFADKLIDYIKLVDASRKDNP